MSVLCPRCEDRLFTPYGEEGDRVEAPPPALSRAADVFICSWCGMHEGFMDLAGIPLPPPDEWPVQLPEIEEVDSYPEGQRNG